MSAAVIFCRVCGESAGDKVGSAFALARSIVESMFRGLWLNFCATDAEVHEFERADKLPLNMTEMARAIDQKYQGRVISKT